MKKLDWDLVVVIAVRDGQNIILDALNSIINQDAGIRTYISIVNDRSIDDTSRKVLEFYGHLDKNIGFNYRSLDNSVGPGEARNIAEFMAPDSRYLAFIDADDVWFPNHVSSKINKLELDIGDIVYGGMQDVFLTIKDMLMVEQKIGDRLMFQPAEAHSNPAMVIGYEKYFLTNRCNITIPSTVIMRRDLFKLVGGFPKGIVCGEDGVMWRRLAEANRKFVYDPNITIKYRCLDELIGANQSSSLRMPSSGGRHLIGKFPHINGNELDDDWRKEMSFKLGNNWHEKLKEFHE